MFGDLPVRLGCDRLLPVADHENRDMVGWKCLEIRIETEKFGAAGQFDTGFFVVLPTERGFNGFVFFDASAWKMPAAWNAR